MQTKNTNIQTLSTGWKLIWDRDNSGKNEEWFKFGIPEENSVDAVVPSFVHMYFPDCFGVAWYQLKFITHLHASESEVFLLKFGMADFLCEVYLNGTLVGTHRGTEDPFEFDVTSIISPECENLLCVRVSKPWTEEVDGYRFGEIPHRNQLAAGAIPGACYNEFGLHGEIELAVEPKLRITDIFIYGNIETSTLEIEYTTHSDYSFPVAARMDVNCGDKRSGQRETGVAHDFIAAPGNSTFKLFVPINDLKLWDIDDPNLYFVYSTLSYNGGTQSIYKHCGFRSFIVGEDGYFYLNGRRIFLRCSHTGNCFPESTHHLSRDKSLIRKDFVLAKAAGLNAVRFISGCALPEQLDYCDELGLMIYEEPVSSWLQQDGSRAKEIYQLDLFTLMRRDRSHPCITIWGFLNETSANPPYGDCCRIARESLKEARKIDPTRLILYSSGRWDGDASVGSVSNPFSEKWECLWNREKENIKEIAGWRNGVPGGYFDNVGDVHIYPQLPVSKEHIKLIRTIGSDVKRPVFVSEFGIGSIFNVFWQCRQFEASGASKNMPDVKMVFTMAEIFMSELKRYGFEDEYAFPIDIARESERLHSRQRAFCFDMVRSNPFMCGYSITGLLDHSICGEGLWSLTREYKPGVCDALQNGFAPLKWCLFISDPHVYSGGEFEIEGVLANENILKARDYPVCVRIIGSGEGVVYSENLTLIVTPEDLKYLSVPVFKKTLSLNVPAGEYVLRAELLEGAAATDSMLKFYISDTDDIKTEVSEITACGLNAATEHFLSEKGVKITPLSEADESKKSVVLVGDISGDKSAVWEKLNHLLDCGCRVIAASRYAFERDGDYSYYMPMANKPQSIPNGRHNLDWLYHKEYLTRRGHAYFSGLPTGIMDMEYWMYLLNSHYFTCDDIALPETTVSACFGPGISNSSGYSGGFNIGVYKVGNGALVLNSYSILENIGVNPAADRLLVNMLNAEHAEL
jgi:Beta-galactosidase/beta-glucuronidase